MEKDELPPGVASNEVAGEPAPTSHVLRAETGFFSMTGSSAVLLLTPASHNLLAHARTLAAKGEHQFAVVFAHAACELHTEGELIRLLAPRADKVLADLVLPDERDTKSLATARVATGGVSVTSPGATRTPNQ
jgi:hypothetical protein